VLIVAGLSLKNLKPRVWDKTSPYYLPGVEAVMVSYTDFHKVTVQRQAAMTVGLHEYLGVSKNIKIYLDNGAFYFLTHDGETPRESYEEFVDKAKPDWWPIPQDFIPSPQMTLEQQQLCRKRTMDMNEAYQDDGYVPIIHISRVIEEYIAAVESSDALKAKSSIGLSRCRQVRACQRGCEKRGLNRIGCARTYQCLLRRHCPQPSPRPESHAVPAGLRQPDTRTSGIRWQGTPSLRRRRDGNTTSGSVDGHRFSRLEWVA